MSSAVTAGTHASEQVQPMYVIRVLPGGLVLGWLLACIYKLHTVDCVPSANALSRSCVPSPQQGKVEE